MKKSKKNYTIIALIVLLLAIGVGYAVFSQNLVITGTVTADAEFDVRFSAATIDNERGTATTSTDGHTVTISNVVLTHPGDTVTGRVTILNRSSVPVKINSIVMKRSGVEEASLESDYITITPPALTTASPTLANGANTGELPFTIEWPATATSLDVNNEVNDSLEFEITYTYEQDI